MTGLPTLRDDLQALIRSIDPDGDNVQSTADEILALILPPDYTTRAQAIIDRMDATQRGVEEAQGIPPEARAALHLYLQTIKRLCYQLGAVDKLWPEPLRLEREDWLARHAEPILDVMGWARWGVNAGAKAIHKTRDHARCDAIEEMVRRFVDKVRRRKVEEATLFLMGFRAADDSHGGIGSGDPANAYRAFRAGEPWGGPPDAVQIARLVEGVEP